MSPWLDTRFASIFAKSALPFHLLFFPKEKKKVLKFDEVQLLIFFFSFMDHFFGVLSRNSSSSTRSRKYSSTLHFNVTYLNL